MSRAETVQSSLARVLGVIFVFAFVAVLVGGVLPGTVSAGQVTTRSITMSSSAGSATGVTYTVTFTPATSITNPDILVDFCSNDPLIGDTCTATAGTDVPNFTSASASAGWTLTTIGSNRGVKLTTTTLSTTASTPITITLSGVTNPSNVPNGSAGVGIFYGRVLTYPHNGAGSNTSASPGSYTDYGGVAMSTASNISITSKVFETLSYCVYQGGTCGTPPTLALGNTTTGALDSSTTYVNSNAQYSIATNAASGVNITMTGTTLCRPGGTCTTGTNAFTISAMTTNAARSVGTEQFGACLNSNSLPSGVTIPAQYKDSTAANCNGITTGTYSGSSTFGFNDSASTGGTNNAAGSQIFTSTGPISSYVGNFTFLGDVSTTTEAGIYTTSLNTVATGTF